MNLPIKIKVSAVIIITAAAIAALYLINDSGTINLSKNFFQGLVFGVVSAAAAVWLAAILVTLYRRRKTTAPEEIQTYNRQLTAGAGWLCLLTGLVLTRIDWAGEAVYIISAVLFIVSIVLLTAYLAGMKKFQSGNKAV